MDPAETRLITVDRDAPQASAIDEAARALRRGELVAFATETVYGLGADALDPDAVARIFAAKGRPATNPLIVHAADVDGARACVSAWPDDAQTLAEAFWPGPLTLVLPASANIPPIVTAGRSTVGIRIPRPEVARALIRAAGRPIAAPSANRSNGVSPTLAEHVRKDLDGRIAMILDSGPAEVGLESTVLDLSGVTPVVLRPGQVSSAEIAAILGRPVFESTVHAPASGPYGLASPGQLAVHYAPRTPADWVERLDEGVARAEQEAGVGLLVIGRTVERGSGTILSLETPEQAARELYATLHAWDELGLSRIVIVPPPDLPEWRAIRDRLRRATGPR
ncbi:L-threonylcarbamoyladenylate synthase [Isosphaeraceae bacterium EP7]